MTETITQPSIATARTTAECEKLLLDNLEHFNSAIARLGREARLEQDDIDELKSFCLVRLVSNDYSILRSYSGSCRFTSYLGAVLRNLLRDFRNSIWGKWRPSASAKRLGLVAIEYERLTHRDGLLHHEATQILRSRLPSEAACAHLEALPTLLPARLSRTVEALEDQADPRVPDPDARIELRPGMRPARIRQELVDALQALPTNERRILALHFIKGLSLAEISRQQRLQQRALYTLRGRSLKTVKQTLQGRGITWEQIENYLHRADDDLGLAELLQA